MALHGRFSAQPLELVTMIEEPGQPAGDLEIPSEERTMFKTISAALLAVSVLAAPAFAATTGKTTDGKTTEAGVTAAPQAKTDLPKSGVKVSHRHYKHHRHLGSIKTNKKIGAIKTHNRMGAIKTHVKVSSKHAASTIKRG
jgi:hypothetical protein